MKSCFTNNEKHTLLFFVYGFLSLSLIILHEFSLFFEESFEKRFWKSFKDSLRRHKTKNMGLNGSKKDKVPTVPAATNSTTTTTATKVDDSVPLPPQLSNIKTVESVGARSAKLGELGAELAREFMEGDGPKYWDKMKGNEGLVTIDPKSKEYAQVLRHFRKTSNKTIVRIERCQNKFLWRRYQAKKISMMTKNKGVINERVLFHGTRATPPEKICKERMPAASIVVSEHGYYGYGHILPQILHIPFPRMHTTRVIMRNRYF